MNPQAIPAALITFIALLFFMKRWLTVRAMAKEKILFSQFFDIAGSHPIMCKYSES